MIKPFYSVYCPAWSKSFAEKQPCIEDYTQQINLGLRYNNLLHLSLEAAGSSFDPPSP